MPKIRILVVDDSVVVRRMVSDALAADPQLEVAGTAANGKIALAKIPQVNPDIVILDVEMPELDGIGTLVGIRKSLPALPVIMYSTLTQRGAEATLDALSKGATDYVTKPSNVGSAAQGLECIRTQLIPKIKAICGRILGVIPPFPSGRTQLLPRRSRHAWHSLAVKSESTLLPSVCPRAGPMPLPFSFQPFRATFPSPWSSFNTCLRSLPVSWRSAWRRSRKSAWKRVTREPS